jgi:hypothetical protein
MAKHTVGQNVILENGEQARVVEGKSSAPGFQVSSDELAEGAAAA